MKLKFLFIVLLSYIPFGLSAQTKVPALITSNQIWDQSGSPYRINQNTLIDSGVRVRVMPGTTIEAPNDPVKLIING